GCDPRKRALSSRVRGRPSTLSDHQVRSSSDTAEQLDRVGRDEQEDKRSVSIAPVSQAGSSRDINDIEILGHYGNIAREYEDDDVTNMRAYAPLSYTDSPPPTVHRGSGYKSDLPRLVGATRLRQLFAHEFTQK
ncbi:hypothetical protein F441_11343, partial [Phytophthora nicotianae CJ01A1]